MGGRHVLDLRALGLLGVQIFFALSGFLITTRLLQEEHQAGSVSLLHFYQRRAFRILPAALGFLALIGVLSSMGVIQVTLGRWMSAAFFVANYSSSTPSWYLGHFWSLAVEEHFYFLWPILFVVEKRSSGRLTWMVGLILTVTLWRAVAWKFGITSSNAATFMGRTDIVADNLLFGVGGALIYRHTSWWMSWRRFLASRATSAALAIVVLTVTLFEPQEWKLALFFWSVKAAVIPLMIGGSILRAQSGGSTLLELPAIKWVGHLSYSLYLWQQLFLVWNEFRVPALGWVQRIPISYVCALGCAYASYRWIEKPMIKVGRRLLADEVRTETLQDARFRKDPC